MAGLTKGAMLAIGITGTVFDFAGTTAPDGWLMCYGQAVSRTMYSQLFSVIGTTYGAGDGTTTFNVPDCRGRVAAGKDNMGGTAASRLSTSLTGSTLGAVGGAETHTLTVAQMPSHNHGVNDPTHAHGIQTWNQVNFDATGGPYPVGADAGASGGLGQVTSTAGSGTGISIQNNGSGTAHNNTQPTIVFNKIIKA